MEEVKTEQPKVRTMPWEPPCFKNEAGDALYTGHLVLRAVSSEERTQQQLDVSATRPVDNEAKDGKANGEWLLSIWKKHKDLIIGSEVFRVKDGMKLSLDDVMFEEGLMRIPLEFAGAFMNGFKLGNS